MVVIDELEPIQVEQHQCAIPSCPGAAVQFAHQQGLKKGCVHESGEPVVHGQVAEPIDQSLQLCQRLQIELRRIASSGVLQNADRCG